MGDKSPKNKEKKKKKQDKKREAKKKPALISSLVEKKQALCFAGYRRHDRHGSGPWRAFERNHGN